LHPFVAAPSLSLSASNGASGSGDAALKSLDAAAMDAASLAAIYP
jgi:hypothetical protein